MGDAIAQAVGAAMSASDIDDVPPVDGDHSAGARLARQHAEDPGAGAEIQHRVVGIDHLA